MIVVDGRYFAAICVICVSAVCGGCYKPAAGESSSYTPPTSAAPTPIATPSPSATPSASAPSAAIQASVEAALRNPYPPNATPVEVRPSRSPVRRPKAQAAPDTADGVLGLTFDDLVFPMEKDQPFVESLLTDKIRGLFGRKVKIRGYIHPSCPFQTGVTSFILVRDDQSCCFGPGAALYDAIIVDMLPGRTTNFSTKPIAVEGVLTFREFKDFGKHLAIYHLDAEAVE
jgi:hypothetical protein